MVLDRWKCDPQNAGYLEVGFPFFDPTKNLALAGSEFVDFFRSLRLSLFTLREIFILGQQISQFSSRSRGVAGLRQCRCGPGLPLPRPSPPPVSRSRRPRWPPHTRSRSPAKPSPRAVWPERSQGPLWPAGGLSPSQRHRASARCCSPACGKLGNRNEKLGNAPDPERGGRAIASQGKEGKRPG